MYYYIQVDYIHDYIYYYEDAALELVFFISAAVLLTKEETDNVASFLVGVVDLEIIDAFVCTLGELSSILYLTLFILLCELPLSGLCFNELLRGVTDMLDLEDTTDDVSNLSELKLLFPFQK